MTIHNVNYISSTFPGARATCGLKDIPLANQVIFGVVATCPDCRMVVMYGMKVFEPEDGTYPPDRKDVE